VLSPVREFLGRVILAELPSGRQVLPDPLVLGYLALKDPRQIGVVNGFAAAWAAPSMLFSMVAPASAAP